SFPTESLDKLCDDPIVYQNHDHGISPKKFSENKNLQRLFVILTTSKDKKKEKEYVSTMRSCEYPITLFQWHPEKIEFEWGSPNIPRTCGAIRVSRLAAAFLVREADKSSKRPDSQELKQLIDYLKLIDDRRIRRRQYGQ
ncbi:Gamma-glutamyl hydrolase, partial [Stylosanthes scabra]|nr:Gamma-glutamyl hydrolase [Stylosanthes scabra]